jgi:hypothetical protein
MAEWPARFEIRVQGNLGDAWSEWFGGLQVVNRDDETILSGMLPDQPALHGVLDKIRDLGLDMTSVQRSPPGPGNHSDADS